MRDATGPITNTAPRRTPRVGAVLDLAAGQWRYEDRPLRLLVRGSRPEISRWYGGGWVWVYGTELDENGDPREQRSALVACDAIPDDLADTTG
jgi:hypothetical protein